MGVARADRAVELEGGRGSTRHEHTTSSARCEIARNKPAADPGQTCSAHQLAATSRSFDDCCCGAVPFARAVVKIRGCGFDGDMETVRLHVAVKTAPSSDQTRAGEWYRAFSHYVAATFIGPFFPPDPLPLPQLTIGFNRFISLSVYSCNLHRYDPSARASVVIYVYVSSAFKQESRNIVHSTISLKFVGDFRTFNLQLSRFRSRQFQKTLKCRKTRKSNRPPPHADASVRSLDVASLPRSWTCFVVSGDRLVH
jgi:hypothetical protein